MDDLQEKLDDLLEKAEKFSSIMVNRESMSNNNVPPPVPANKPKSTRKNRVP